ncbi:MAG: M1 family metallopeptidase [Bacteroidia bacterium]
MKKLLLLLIVIPIAIGSLAQQTRTYIADKALTPREHSVDMQHLKLEVSFEPQKGLVKGKVTHTFLVLQHEVDSIFLDAPGITFKDVKLDGVITKYKTDNNGITIYPGSTLHWEQTHDLTLEYEATPRKGIYFIGWNQPRIDTLIYGASRKQIWTQGQGTDNRHWIPCYDEQNDKLTTEVIVTFDKEYKVLSNGTKLKEKDNGNGTRTWHYKMQKPHTTYLMMLGIGKYEIEERKSATGVPIHLWYYPEYKSRVEPTYRYSVEMFDFFEKEIGVPYGWESYSQIPVQDFMYGAMENTTATLFGDFFLVDERSYLDRNYVAVNAHELAHQWFGDLVTARSAAHHWLQESFATHYNLTYEREVFGQDHFDWARREAVNKALDASRHDKKPVAHSEAGSVRHYPKGSVVLQMLKYVTSREAFNKSIKHYLEKHKYQNVDSEDLLVAFHETLGKSLDWFWEEWIYKGGEPHYVVTYREETENGKQQTVFSVSQEHELSDVVGLFKMPIAFEVHYTDGSKDSKIVWIENKHHEVKVENILGKKISFVLFDPNSEVMKSFEFRKSLEMLKEQALKAPNMLDRYDAVLAMRNTEIELKQDLLIDVFNNEKFHGIKSEVVYQLVNEKDSKSLELITKAINDKDAQVRKAVITHVKNIPAALLAEYEKLLTDASYETITLALEKLCIQFPDNLEKYVEFTRGIIGTRGRNVEIKRMEFLEIVLKRMSARGENMAAPMNKFHLIGFTSSSYEFMTRQNAFASLKRLDYFDKKALANMLDAAFSSNNRLAGPAIETLKYFYAKNEHRKMIDDYLATQKRLSWQEEIIKQITN